MSLPRRSRRGTGIDGNAVRILARDAKRELERVDPDAANAAGRLRNQEPWSAVRSRRWAPRSHGEPRLGDAIRLHTRVVPTPSGVVRQRGVTREAEEAQMMLADHRGNHHHLAATDTRGSATAHGGKVDGLVEHNFLLPSGGGHWRACLGGMATNTGATRLR